MMTEPKKPSQPDITAALESMAMLANAVSKHAADIAHARRTLFQAYVSEGFTESQALELCKTLMLG